MLTITDHRRDSLALNYIYVVDSRRSGGLSIGINLNTNNACNWRCIYCQVPDLRRGSAPAADLDLLEQELGLVLGDIVHGNFFEKYNIRSENRDIRDLAISGNGEPTTCSNFDQVIKLIGSVLDSANLKNKLKPVLITNGSLINHTGVRKGIAYLSALNGEVWFKLDSATNAGINSINNANITITKIRTHLAITANLCPTWIQTCVFGLKGKPPPDTEQEAYIQFLSIALEDGIPLKGVLLYGIARPSMQKEASDLSRLSAEWLYQYAEKIRKTGINVKISA
jgi:wyosine [tRNA(Phe)-imidazoG37] synthetase (radical SAM superfamily)